VAEKKRFFDIWIVEMDKVYTEVPYAVVTDWLQQGRLLEDDKAKPSGTKEWQRLGDLLEMQPFVPRAEVDRPDDQAEALEAVHLEFAYKKPHGDDDEDVDMIPLIDVSLVLLVFFMLTASAVAVISPVETPETEHGVMVDAKEGLNIDIDLVRDDKRRPVQPPTPLYSLRVGDRPAEEEEKDLVSLAAILDRLKAKLAKMSGQTELVIHAHKDLKAKVARDLLQALQREPFRGKINANFYGVRGAQP
jgi:biopolymer transport protein ExbD